MSYIDTPDGAKLFTLDWGAGPPVVLIHGWPLSSDMWEYQMAELPHRGMRCIAYDRRGFGRSSKTWSGHDYDTFADDLKAVLDGLDVNDVTLVGFSMGGGEVVRYMSRHGGARVGKVVLVSSIAPYLLQTPNNPNGVKRSVFDDIIENLSKDRPNFLATFAKQFYGAGILNFSISQELLDWTMVVAMMASPKATKDCVRAFSETDLRSEMAAIRVPTLVIHGSSDDIVPIDATGREAARMISGARLEVYSGSPHGLFFTDKDRLNADLTSFAHGETARRGL